MNVTSLTLGAAALVVGLGSSAYAQQLKLSSPYDATLTVNSDGTLEYQNASYTSVLQQDKLFSDFSGLAAGATIVFAHSVVNKDDQHTITFSEPFAKGNAYSWSYDIPVPDQVPQSLARYYIYWKFFYLLGGIDHAFLLLFFLRIGVYAMVVFNVFSVSVFVSSMVRHPNH